MYYQRGGLGFSLKPPKWARNLIPRIGATADSVSSAAGRVQNAIAAANQPQRSQQQGDGGEMPSWVVPAAIGVGVLVALPLLMRSFGGSGRKA